MIRKPRDLPPAISRAFVKDMEAFFAEENRLKRDEIALRQLMFSESTRDPASKRSGFPT
jgi:hypothetical protein